MVKHIQRKTVLISIPGDPTFRVVTYLREITKDGHTNWHNEMEMKSDVQKT